MAGRLAPSNVLYSNPNDTKWQHQHNGSKSPSRHANCKCKEVVELKREDDCDDCSMNEEIRIRKEAYTSSRRLEESPKNTKRELSPKERPSSGKLQRKQLLSPLKHESSSMSTRGTLEKSNSLTESKPQKQLRTTKSLSPRPPIKHQHAITVSDEYNVVSLKVSPADDFDDVLIRETRNESVISDSSPEGVAGSLQLDDRHKNHRSTGCLVYVPSDPWTKMEPGKGRKKGGNRMKKLMDVKSLSKPDLIDDDPWVFDESRKMKDRKSATFRGTHSKSLHVESKSGTARPRLQRSKSPVFDELKNPPSSPNNLSLKDPLSSLSPKLGYHLVPEDSSSHKAKKKSQFLNVSNPNLLQPRHSFSTSASKKDDELTLNIRRLSEQIKHSSNYASYGNFSSAGSTASTSPKPAEMEKKGSSLLNDSLLETTC